MDGSDCNWLMQQRLECCIYQRRSSKKCYYGYLFRRMNWFQNGDDLYRLHSNWKSQMKIPAVVLVAVDAAAVRCLETRCCYR